MDLGPVSIIRLLVRLARGKVKRAGDLLVEQDIEHRVQDAWIEGDGEFSDVARTVVRVEDFFDALLGACGHVFDPTVFEVEHNVIEHDAVIEAWSRDRYLALH